MYRAFCKTMNSDGTLNLRAVDIDAVDIHDAVSICEEHRSYFQEHLQSPIKGAILVLIENKKRV